MLSDFGNAFKVSDSMQSRLCQAPESIRGEAVDLKVDTWAVGVLAFYLFSRGNYPFPGTVKEIVDAKILKQDPNMVSLKLDEDNQLEEKAMDFIEKCLNKDPTQRPTVSQLMSDPWLLSFDSIPAV